MQDWVVFKSSQLPGSITLHEAVSDGQAFEDTLKWWQRTLIYHLYPRSHKDSDGNGIGDIQGHIKSFNYFYYFY